MTRRIRQTIIAETRVPGGTRCALEFRALGDAIPAILQLPDHSPAPAVLLIHGYRSRKETMAEGIGAPLLERGIASLAIDLPMHGGRGGAPGGGAMELIRHWQSARAESALAIHYLAARREVDRTRLAVAGYSLGSFLALALAAEERRIRGVVLAAGGDLPAGQPVTQLARIVVDPVRLVRQLDGRPLLMLNGTRDRTVTPDQARRLFAAAEEPKEIRWFDAAHRLPGDAAAEAARWLEANLGASGLEQAS